MFLLTTLIAMAQVPTDSQQSTFTGVFLQTDTEAELDARWQAEVERVAATLPWIVRGVVRSALRNKRPECAELNVTLTAADFSVQCTGQDRLQRRFDGTDAPLTNDSGQAVDVVLNMLTDAVRFDLSSPSGSIASLYSLDGDTLIVTTETLSPRVSEPFRWQQSYRRQ